MDVREMIGAVGESRTPTELLPPEPESGAAAEKPRGELFGGVPQAPVLGPATDGGTIRETPAFSNLACAGEGPLPHARRRKKARERRARVAEGGCYYCERRALPNKSVCRKHLEYRRQKNAERETKGNTSCSVCGEMGHNRRTCPRRRGR